MPARFTNFPKAFTVAGARSTVLLPLVVFLLEMPGHADEVIRIMAANTTSGNIQSYDPGEGNRIFQGLDPDIALVQELNVGTGAAKNTAATYRSWVTANFGSSFDYRVEATLSNGDIPNGIVSRYPIIASGEWDDTTMINRDYVWAKIDIPGDKHLWAVSVHFSSGGGSSQRNAEATEIRNCIYANVPAADYLVFGGDLNTDNRGEACVGTLSAVVVTAGPYPVDQTNDPDTNSSRGKPYDWVIPDADLDARKTTLILGSNSFPDGLVFDSRVFSPLAAVAPVQFSDSAAVNMHHMAVMRAFLIPTNELPVIVQGNSISSSISQNNYPITFSASLTATDVDGDPLAWTIATAAAHGSASVGTSGNSVTVGYTPNKDYLGSDSFAVQVSDGQGGTDTITVNVTANPVSRYDAWTFDRFAPLLPNTQAAVWGEAANPDNDDSTNFEEFAFGLNPKVADVVVNPLQISFAGNRPVLSFLVRMEGGVPALSYELQSSADPAAPSWLTVLPEEYSLIGETVMDADFRRRVIQFLVPAIQPRTFYRLKITR